MHDGWLLAGALLCSLGGMSVLALAMDVHWEQVATAAGNPGNPGNPGGPGDPGGLGPRSARRLRLLGAAAILASLALCLGADHPSIAVLVWIMSLVVSAFIVAMVLAVLPR